MTVEGTGDATSTPAAPSSGGNNASCGRGRGRGSAGRFGRGGRGGSATPAIIKSSFKGNTKDMNGHVFQVHHETVDLQQFDKTVEALSEYAMKTLKKSGDLISFFKAFSHPSSHRWPTLSPRPRSSPEWKLLYPSALLLSAFGTTKSTTTAIESDSSLKI